MTKFKLTLVLIFLMSANFLNAQISKGTLRIGPNLSYLGSTQEIDGLNAKFKTTNLELGVSGGYYVIDDLEVGLNFQIISDRSKVGSNEDRRSGIFIGPSVTYMISVAENLYVPITGGFGLNSLTVNDDVSEVTFNGLGYGIGAGLEYLVGNKLGARLLLGFDFGSLSDNDSTAEIDVSEIDLGVGVNFYFSR